ncbi:hypothetical protein QJ48_03285 [Paenibacillus sp. A3]|uniref:hypothetical protein n=1 Tax=Paenibacillus sp. A3 TaxID=1337054 RepID=UPI0006D5B41A|nr:hypothetical protein [Paenibacillus sp. A3]KPV60808.1 hypothetical protein QJ48_03285 [Paenibacillus sp. A3]
MKAKVAIVASALLVAVTGSALAGYDSTRFSVDGVRIEGELEYDGTKAKAKTHTVDRDIKVDYLSVDVSIKKSNGSSLGNKPNTDTNDDYVSTRIEADGGAYATGYHQVTHNGETNSRSTSTSP